MKPYRKIANTTLATRGQKWVGAIAVALALFGVTAATAQERSATAVESRHLGPRGRIEVLGQVYAGLPSLRSQQTRMVAYYLPGTTKFVGAASIFVNDMYHTSLVPGGFSYLCMTPGRAQISVREIHVGGQPKDGIDTTINLTMNGGETQFMRVEVNSGRAKLQSVDRDHALQELNGLRIQLHTISRVEKAQACDVVGDGVKEQAAQPSMVVLAEKAKTEFATDQMLVKSEQVLLDGDAIFAHGKSDLEHLPPAGLVAIQQLIKRIQNQYASVQEITVVGHADPIGAAESNERLSLERANTVSKYLQENAGIKLAQVRAEGHGERKQKVRCTQEPNAPTMSCNQPNRRIEIIVTGVAR